jgi:hypothetical protein
VHRVEFVESVKSTCDLRQSRVQRRGN